MDGRGPEDRETAPNASIRRRFPVLRPALSKSAGLATPPQFMVRWANLPLPGERGEAEPTRPGRVGRWEPRLRRTLAFGADRLSTGRRRSSDRRRFRRQSSVGCITPARPSLRSSRLCGFFSYGWLCASAALRLCVSSSLWFPGGLGVLVVHSEFGYGDGLNRET